VQDFREIPLNNGLVALVDADDYERIAQHKWRFYFDKKMGSCYALRHAVNHGKRTTLSMHREVLGLSFGDPRRVDHRDNSQTLDNRRSNLRICPCGENNQNARLHKDTMSGLKGACWHKLRQKWVSYITKNYKRVHLGYFATKEEAHARYCEASEAIHGEFGRTG
jgi:hypothetical protein